MEINKLSQAANVVRYETNSPKASKQGQGNQEQMKKMESAFEDGFKEATKSWGKELPDISKQTFDAVKGKFAKFYGEESDMEKPVEGE